MQAYSTVHTAYVQAHMHGERKTYEEQQQTTDQQWMYEGTCAYTLTRN